MQKDKIIEKLSNESKGLSLIEINDLLNLEIGDVIILDQKINEDITINIGDAKAYKAKPGILGSKNGVEITDIIR